MLAGCGAPEELLSVLNTTEAPETLAVIEAETEPDTVPERAKVQVLSTENADLASGSTQQFAVQCDASKIVNMNAIVYSYVDSNGEEIINENIYDWLVNTQEGYQIKTYTVD